MADDAATAPPALTSEDMRRALDEVLCSRAFSRSDRLKNLLRYLCEAKIQGRESQLNEYTIGVEALGRPEGYSPVEDSSVRSRTYEVRQKLERYYTDEVPNAKIRILLPKGSHSPQFVIQPTSTAVRVTESGEDSPPRRPTAPHGDAPPKRLSLFGSLGRGTIALMLGGVLASLTLALWVGTAVMGESASQLGGRSSALPQWTPALEEVWAPLLDPKTPILLTFETRLFLRAGQLVVRDPKVNDPNKIELSRELLQVQEMFNVPQLRESKNYSDSGGTLAVFLLTRHLAPRKAAISIKRAGDVTGEDMRGSHIIYVGKPTTDPGLRAMLARGEIIDYGGRVRIAKPRNGELAEYVDRSDPASPDLWGEKYGVISMMPGPEPSRRILIFAGVASEHPWGLAQYLTAPREVEDLVKHLRLPSGKLPEFYQVLVKAQYRSMVPARIDYITHRVLY